LTANTTYYFRVVAVNAGGSSNGAASKAVLTAPDVPTVTAANGTKGGTFTGGLNFTPLGLTYKLNWTGAATGSVTVTKSGPITFAKAGTYSMTLTATNASGSATSAAVNVTVQ
jgi:PKD repeat protein